jgi:hypothetical protein
MTCERLAKDDAGLVGVSVLQRLKAQSTASDVTICALKGAAVPTVRSATSTKRQMDMVPQRASRVPASLPTCATIDRRDR